MAGLMPRGTCLVMNAKIVTDVDLRQVIAFHRARGAAATLVVRPDANALRWGAIHVDEQSGRVQRILEHEAPGAVEAPPFQFTGIHVLEPELIAAIPEQPALRCVIRTAYRALLERGAPICAHVHRGYFYDHSTPGRYLQGNLNLLAGRAAPVHAPGPLTGVAHDARLAADVELNGPVLVGAGAVVEAGARLGPGVVLGPGARVAAGCRLRQAVVWPGALVERSLERVVVTPNEVVEVPRSGDPAASPR
jgi:NDP-sugar pyrophosphorylase family protein